MSRSFGREFWRNIFGLTFFNALFGAILVISRGLPYLETSEFWWAVGGLELFAVCVEQSSSS